MLAGGLGHLQGVTQTQIVVHVGEFTIVGSHVLRAQGQRRLVIGQSRRVLAVESLQIAFAQANLGQIERQLGGVVGRVVLVVGLFVGAVQVLFDNDTGEIEIFKGDLGVFGGFFARRWLGLCRHHGVGRGFLDGIQERRAVQVMQGRQSRMKFVTHQHFFQFFQTFGNRRKCVFKVAVLQQRLGNVVAH